MAAMEFFLREYLYVDEDRARSLVAQLVEGVAESKEEVVGEASKKSLSTPRLIALGAREESEERLVTSSLRDALLRDLEDLLDQSGYLRDISPGEVKDAAFWTASEDNLPPGRLVRLTAPGYLFPSEVLKAAVSGYSSAVHGLSEMGILTNDEPESAAKVKPPGAKSSVEKKAQRRKDALRSSPGDWALEEALQPGDLPIEGLDRDDLVGMIKMFRGIVPPGVHLTLVPIGPEGPALTLRLEEGRRYMDSSPEVLLSRYGPGLQHWTVLGVVGHHGDWEKMEEVDASESSFSRAGLIRTTGQFLAQLGQSGFLDLPQNPGFSIIPIGVYRRILKSSIDS